MRHCLTGSAQRALCHYSDLHTALCSGSLRTETLARSAQSQIGMEDPWSAIIRLIPRAVGCAVARADWMVPPIESRSSSAASDARRIEIHDSASECFRAESAAIGPEEELEVGRRGRLEWVDADERMVGDRHLKEVEAVAPDCAHP